MQRGLNFDINGRWMGGAAVNRMGGDLWRARGQIDAASIASKRFSNALGGSTWRRQVQQAGMQISDFSVQVAGGQSAILAFTQNAPQFLQNFGAMGGIIAAAVTIMGTFAFAASRMGESVKALSEETEETIAAFGDYKKALENLDPLAYEVFERASKAIRSSSAEARDLLDITKQLTLREFAQDVQAIAAVPTERSGLLQQAGRRDTGLIADFLQVKEIAGLTADSTLQVTQDVLQFQSVLLRLQESSTESIGEQRDALEAVESAMRRILGPTEEMNTKQLKFLLDLVRAQQSFDEAIAATTAQQTSSQEEQAKVTAEIQRSIQRGMALANTIGTDVMKEMVATFKASQDLRSELGDSAFEAIRLAGVDITSGVDSAAKAAARLAAELSVSFAVAQQMQRMGVDVVQRSRVRAGMASGAIPPQAGQDVVSETEMLRREQQEARNKLDETIRRMRRRSISSAASTGGGGGGGSIAGDVTAPLTEIEQAFKRTEQVISSSMLGSFKSLMKGTKSLGDSVRDILGGIIDSVIDLLMTPVFNSLSGALLGSPSGGGLLGMVGGLGGGIGSFEGGGYTGRGPRAGGLDGRGGRLAMIHPNESIYDHNRGQGGSGVTINMTVVTPDAQSFQQSRRQIERQLGQAAQRGMKA
jgi:hypothetical protein